MEGEGELYEQKKEDSVEALKTAPSVALLYSSISATAPSS